MFQAGSADGRVCKSTSVSCDIISILVYDNAGLSVSVGLSVGNRGLTASRIFLVFREYVKVTSVPPHKHTHFFLFCSRLLSAAKATTDSHILSNVNIECPDD